MNVDRYRLSYLCDYIVLSINHAEREKRTAGVVPSHVLMIELKKQLAMEFDMCVDALGQKNVITLGDTINDTYIIYNDPIKDLIGEQATEGGEQ